MSRSGWVNLCSTVFHGDLDGCPAVVLADYTQVGCFDEWLLIYRQGDIDFLILSTPGADDCTVLYTFVVECEAFVPEVPRVLFLGICLDFYYSLLRVLLPQFGFHFDRGSVPQALVEPVLIPS